MLDGLLEVVHVQGRQRNLTLDDHVLAVFFPESAPSILFALRPQVPSMDLTPYALELLINDSRIRSERRVAGFAILVQLDARNRRRGGTFEDIAHGSHLGLQKLEAFPVLLLKLTGEEMLP